MQSRWKRWAQRSLAAGIVGWYAPAIGAVDFWQPEARSPSDLPRSELVVVDRCDGDCCADSVSDCWRDNLQVWLGGEAYKGLGDTKQPPALVAGYTNNAGIVSGGNTSFGLGERPVRGQFGASYGVYDVAGRDTVSRSSSEQQVYATLGIYRRGDVECHEHLSWGLVYDHFWGHQYGMAADQVYLGQVRGIVGYAVNECNEIGFWGTASAGRDSIQSSALAGVVPLLLQTTTVRAANQFNTYWRHNWEFGGSTMAYVGLADSADVQDWIVGVLGQAPLSDRVALYSNVTFALPGSGPGVLGANELQWNFSLGLSYSFGGKAWSSNVSGNADSPLLPVANNGSFMITN